MREKSFLGAVLALYLLAWFLVLWPSGWTVGLAGAVAYAAGQAWCMRSGKFHLSADAVALPLATVAVIVASVLRGTGDLPGLVAAAAALGMAYVAGHLVVALAAAAWDRVVRKEGGDPGRG